MRLTHLVIQPSGWRPFLPKEHNPLSHMSKWVGGPKPFFPSTLSRSQEPKSKATRSFDRVSVFHSCHFRWIRYHSCKILEMGHETLEMDHENLRIATTCPLSPFSVNKRPYLRPQVHSLVHSKYRVHALKNWLKYRGFTRGHPSTPLTMSSFYRSLDHQDSLGHQGSLNH